MLIITFTEPHQIALPEAPGAPFPSVMSPSDAAPFDAY